VRTKKILIITCGKFEKKTTNHVRESVTRVLGLATDLKECSLDVSEFYHPARRQYNADRLLETMSARAPVEYMKCMSLFRGDLFIPILTYIFGQAQLNGRIGIASPYRLRNELYGLKEDNNLMLERFSKVVLHELGHTFGLIHCKNTLCIMRSSTYMEDLDQKNTEFCRQCSEKLQVELDKVLHKH